MMPRLFFCDYETRSAAPIKHGVYRYTEDPTFVPLMLAWAYDDEPVQLAVGADECREVIEAALASDVELVAHNCAFERIVSSRLLGLPVGQYLPPDRWIDTAAIAAEKAYPRALGPLAKALDAEDKDEASEALIRYFCTPIATGNRKGQFRAPEDNPEKWADFCCYCAQDVDTLRDVHKRLGDFPTPEERAAWNADQRINDRGVAIDLDLAAAAVQADAENKTRALELMRQETGLENPNSVVKLREWLNGRLELAGVADPLEDLRADTVEAAVAREDYPQEVRDVLELRAEASLTAAKKYQAAIDRTSPDGRLRGSAMFYGAHTGRFAGRGLQLQNLPCESFPDTAARDNAIDGLLIGLGASPRDLKALLRPMLVGPFVVADYSAIEARVLAWLAGEEWVLQAFREGRDLYVETAKKTGEAVGQVFNRQQGKAQVLGLGYGSGVNGFRRMGAQGTDDELKTQIKAWRLSNPHIVQFWRDLGRAFAQGGEAGRITIEAEGQERRMVLPSGRALIYRDVRKRAFRDPKTGDWARWDDGRVKKEISFRDPRYNGAPSRMHGGIAAENCTQAAARDLLVAALVRLEAEGRRVVSHIHDEIVMEGEGDELAAALSAAMCEAPAWADGIPLRAGADHLDRYAKG